MRAQSVYVSVVVAVTLGACGNTQSPDHVDAPTTSGPDLRFHWVGAAPAFEEAHTTNIIYTNGAGTALVHTAASTYSWTPLELTLSGLVAGNYSWAISDFAPLQSAETFLATAQAGPIASLASDLAPHLTGNEVIVSLDVLPDAYAFVTNGTDRGAPAYQATSIDLPRAQLDAWVASEGAAGRVVTAASASPIAGMIRAYSFARDGDVTAYDTSVVDATEATLATRARSLAIGGYVVTATGRVGDGAAILIGSRARGASPRTVSVQVSLNGPDLRAGDAVVAWILTPPSATMILER